jgi:pimeloyl-ACP methyl ester carboxylesterase
VPLPVGANRIEELAAAVLHNAPFDTFAIAGLSMGGYIALEVLKQAPQRVKKIALLDTNARSDTPEQSEKRRALMAVAQGGGFGKVTEMLLPALVNRARSYDPQVVGVVRTMARNIGVTSFQEQEEAIIHRPDRRPWLKEIRCPTLILCGKQDTLTPPVLHEEMASAIKNAKLVIIEDCGHLSTIEQPEEVNSAMRSWLIQL